MFILNISKNHRCKINHVSEQCLLFIPGRMAKFSVLMNRCLLSLVEWVMDRDVRLVQVKRQ